jgi:MFS transporter, DHA1 family, multidrug resistance protein
MAGPYRWRRNQAVVAVSSFIGFTGFTLVMPFLPLYFRQLGVTDIGEIALWSGLSLGVTPALTALLAPTWGRLGDRFGLKIMIERSLLGFVVVFTLMAFATQAWHILALRAVQALFAGHGGLTLTMAMQSAPADRLASAIGLVQTAQRLGPAIGPVIGGGVAHLVGLRNAFFVSAGLFAAALLMVAFLYRNPAGDPGGPGRAEPGRLQLRQLGRLRNFLPVMVVIFLVQLVDRSLGPILPLYLDQLGTPTDRVPVVSGILFSLVGISAAAGNQLAGQLMRVGSSRTLMAGCALVGAVAIGLMAAATGTGVLMAVAPVFGASLGVILTVAYAAAGAVIPRESRATGFGYLTSAALAGLAISPVVSALIATAGIRLVFVLDALVLVALAIGMRKWMS